MRFTNHYRCPDCGHERQDEWSAMSDDDCPVLDEVLNRRKAICC